MGYKMVKCKSCGADITRSANVCPNCGAKQHQAANAIAAIAVVVMFAAIFFALRGGMSNNQNAFPLPSSNQVVEKPKAEVNVTSITLWHAYAENMVDADNSYKDKTIAVTGKIVDISQDALTNAPMVALTSGKSLDLQPVQCFFPKDTDQNERLAALKDGQEITIIGVCTGMALVHVQISDCYLP